MLELKAQWFVVCIIMAILCGCSDDATSDLESDVTDSSSAVRGSREAATVESGASIDVSSVGGSSVKSTTKSQSALTREVGGASSAYASTVVDAAGGSGSMANQAGGTSSTTSASSSFGGTTAIDESSSLGGGSAIAETTTSAATSVSTGGSSSVVAVAELDSAGIAEQRVITCKPKVYIEFLGHNNVQVSPDTKDVATLVFRVKSDCRDVLVSQSFFYLSAMDYDVTDEDPFRHGVVENFTEIKMVDGGTGQMIGSPVISKSLEHDQQAYITFSDSFRVKRDSWRIIVVKMDVSSRFTTRVLNPRYRMVFNRLIADDESVPVLTFPALTFDDVSSVTVLNAIPTLSS